MRGELKASDHVLIGAKKRSAGEYSIRARIGAVSSVKKVTSKDEVIGEKVKGGGDIVVD